MHSGPSLRGALTSHRLLFEACLACLGRDRETILVTCVLWWSPRVRAGPVVCVESEQRRHAQRALLLSNRIVPSTPMLSSCTRTYNTAQGLHSGNKWSRVPASSFAAGASCNVASRTLASCEKVASMGDPRHTWPPQTMNPHGKPKVGRNTLCNQEFGFPQAAAALAFAFARLRCCLIVSTSTRS